MTVSYLLLYCLFIELGLSDTAEKQLPDSAEKHLPELDALETFYEKICNALPTDELLPKLVAQRVISINDKSKIDATFRIEFERAQHLLDHHIARPLFAGDPTFFYILLDLMSTSSKCRFLVNEIQQYLSTTLKHPKFSYSKFIQQLFCSYLYLTYIHTYNYCFKFQYLASDTWHYTFTF